MSKIGDCLGNKYELRRLLGSGGQAEVWQAIDTDLGRNVAIKILYPPWQDATLRRFKREAMVLAALRHPNIMQIYDFVTTPAAEPENIRAYMVMEYIEGQTLAEYINNTSYKGNFPSYRDIVYLFTSIGSAIDSAHNSGIIHRDIKPANILLDKRYTSRNAMGKPVLTDFGLVKLQGAPLESGTRLGLGTPAYIAPEQVEGRIATRLSDIYSLGVILYEIFTGKLPFHGETAMGLMLQHVEGNPVPPAQINPTISPALNAVILHSMEKDPEKRFPTASAMVTALSEALHTPVSESFNLSSEASRGTADLPTPPEQLMDQHYPPAKTTIDIPQSYQDIGPAREWQQAGNSPNEYLTVKVPTNPLPDANSQIKEQSTLTPVFKPAKQQRRVSFRWTALLIIALLIVLIPVALFVFSRLNSNASSTVIGHAYFLNMPAQDDTLQIALQGLPVPDAGTSYYAWLLGPGDQPETTPVSLGKLASSGGTWHLIYTDPRHRNLLQYYSRFLIIDENANAALKSPTTNVTAWRYSAQFSSTSTSGPSLWQHLQHLLSNDPDLTTLGLNRGGLAYYLNTNIQEILKWAITAVDHSGNVTTDTPQQLVNILYFLDGPCAQQELRNDPNVPISASALQPLFPNDQFSLLNCSQNPSLASLGTARDSYIQHTIVHLMSIMDSPNATTEQRALVSRILTDINKLSSWLTNARSDTLQLITLLNQSLPAQPANQILRQPQAQSLMQDLILQTGHAFGGYADPTSGQTQPGIAVISDLIQQLATFDVAQCSSQASCFAQ